MCICGKDLIPPGFWRSFCSGTCAARAAAAVAYAEKAQAFIAGYVVSHIDAPERAIKVLHELQKGLADVRKGPSNA